MMALQRARFMPVEGTSPTVLTALTAAGTVRRPPAGSILISEGDPADSLHMLMEGWAYRFITTRDGARQITAALLPGDLCNLDVLALRRPDYAVRTRTATTIVSVPRAKVVALTEQEPELAELLLRRMATENATLARWALCLGRKTALAKLAHLLCEMATRLPGAITGDTVRFDLPLTQEHLADMLGLTPVHLNRTLQTLRSQGLVASDNHQMTIASLAALAATADFDPGYLHQGGEPRSTIYRR